MSLGFEAARLEKAPAALLRLYHEALPPELGPNGEFLQDVLRGLLETLQIAFMSTVLGSLLALPVALLAARNLAPTSLVLVSRTFSAALRVMPSLLWAILAVLVVGLGPLAGTLAMTMYTIGFLSKLQYEAIEGVPRDALDSAQAMGASRLHQARYVALPEAANALRSQLIFMFDYNVRASSIVGFVGAGGLGQLLYIHFRFFNYAHVLTILLAMFCTVAALDILSLWARKRFVELSETGGPARPRWLQVLVGHREA